MAILDLPVHLLKSGDQIQRQRILLNVYRGDGIDQIPEILDFVF